MTKHVITVSDGDIVELVPQQPDSNANTEADTAGFASHAQVLPGAPADAGNRLGVIISCPPLPYPPVMLQGDDVQAFTYNMSTGADRFDGKGGYGGGSTTTYGAGFAAGVAIAILFL